MTKLTNMNLGKRKVMFFCKECREFVPDEDKHNRKRHKKNARSNKH